MDPLSIIAGSTGTVAFALASANTLYDFIGSIIDAPIEISAIARDVEALSRILLTLEGWLQLGVIRAAAASSLTTSLNGCVKAMSQLQLILRPYVKSVNANSLRWRSSFTWVMRKQEVRDLRERLQNAKTTLGLSIGLINTYATETGNLELKEQIEAGNEALRSDFAALSSQVIKRKELKLDGASLGARQGSLFNGTDDGLIMRRYLEDLSLTSHPWAGASDIDEILSLKTFSVFEGDSRPGTPIFSATASITEEPVPLSLISRTTPLHRAVIEGNIRSVVELIRNGADPDQIMSDVGTCLHYCAQNDDHIMTEILVLKGAKINILDHKDRSPLEVAFENRSTETACTLLDHGAGADKIIDYMLKMTLEHCGDREKQVIRTCLQHIADKGDEALQTPLIDSINALGPDETQNLRKIWTGIGLPFDVDNEAEPGEPLKMTLSREETTSMTSSTLVVSDKESTTDMTEETDVKSSIAKSEMVESNPSLTTKSSAHHKMKSTVPSQFSPRWPQFTITDDDFPTRYTSWRDSDAGEIARLSPPSNEKAESEVVNDQMTEQGSTVAEGTTQTSSLSQWIDTKNPDYYVDDELFQLAHLLPTEFERDEKQDSRSAGHDINSEPQSPNPQEGAPRRSQNLDRDKPVLLKQFSWE